MSDQYDGPLMAQQILRLQAECAALKADAERYRHLCERVPDPAWLNNCIDAAREVKP